MKCPFCNKENPNDARFCRWCGKNLEQIDLSGNVPENQRSSEAIPSMGRKSSGNKCSKQKILAIVSSIATVLIVASIVFVMMYLKQDKDEVMSDNSEKEYYYQEIDDGRVLEKDGLYYVDAQILLVASESALFDDVEKLVSDYDGEIVGYLSFTNDYQIDLSGDYSYEELKNLCTKIEQNDLIDTATLSYVEKLSTESIDYTLDPWIDADNTSDNSGSEWNAEDPAGNNWWAEAIGMMSVWSTDIEYETVRVGIFDTIFDTNNEDLDDTFVQTWNNEWNNDDFISEHGTAVAGIIGAEAENNFGIAGVSQNAELYGFAVESNGYVSSDEAVWGDVFGYKYAIAIMLDEGIKVINISMGQNEKLIAASEGDREALNWLDINSSLLSEFLKKYIESGFDFLICKTAGNQQGLDAGYDLFGYISDEEVAERIIMVGAAKMDESGNYVIADLSNVGDRVDVYAPGVDVLTDVPNNETRLLDGTSFSAPIVSGIATLIWGANPNLTANQVRSIILASISASALQEDDDIWYEILIDGYCDSDGFEVNGDDIPIVNAYVALQLALSTEGLAGNADSDILGSATGMIYSCDENGQILDEEFSPTMVVYDENGLVVASSIVAESGSDITEIDISLLSDYDSSGTYFGFSYTFLLPEGIYTIELAAEGYDTLQRTITITQGEALITYFGMTTSNDATQGVTSDSSEVLYAEILDMFYDNIQSGWSEYDGSLYSENYSYIIPRYYPESSYIDKIGYAFIDLNEDGTDELLIGVDGELEESISGTKNLIYDLYTCIDGKVIHIFASEERMYYQLCDDNTIYFTGSGGALTSEFTHYQIGDDVQRMEIIESIRTDPDENWENTYWYYSDIGWYNPDTFICEDTEYTMISEDDANNILEAWPETITLPLIYFSEYNRTR